MIHQQEREPPLLEAKKKDILERMLMKEEQHLKTLKLILQNMNI
eukprot:CAMPEP_0197014560 /NCGR_PEP_ID=MMETSP1380-20130617/70777_1 /TAXON_ID=5936 /ORGANISM="Euplotes crassus, Strain CT5" /LENGTH=43 /DNA_ID= /DNA_START= /DNA_END= /DNA_ORIENTATION=